MNEREARANKLLYVGLGALALWTVFVIVLFFRSYPLNPAHAVNLIRNLAPPPFPSEFFKIVLAIKRLFLIALLTTAGVVTGRRLLRALGALPQGERGSARWDIMQELALALGLGWGLLIYANFLLGALGGLYPTAAWGLIALAVLLCLFEFPLLIQDLKHLFRPQEPGERSLAFWGGGAALLTVALLLVVAALSPRIPHDAMVYHLNIPRIYADAHGFIAIPYHIFSNMFLNMEMLYMTPLLMGDYVIGNLTHLVLGVASALFLYGFARGILGPAVAMLATLMFVLTPTALDLAPVCMVDLGMTFYFLLAVGCFWKWKSEGSRAWFILLGVFAGVFAGIKYTSITGLIAVSGVIAVAGMSSPGRRINRTAESLMLFVVIVSAFLAPYFVKNYLIADNPVYPLFSDLLGGRWLVPGQEEKLAAVHLNEYGMGRSLWNLLALPWNVTMRGGYFREILTPLWLIFLPGFVLLRPKPSLLKWIILLCAIYFAAWAFSAQNARFLLPIFPFLSLLAAWTIVELARRSFLASRGAGITYTVFMAAALGLVWLCIAVSYLLPIPSEYGPVVWGKESREDYLSRTVFDYAALTYMNENLPKNAKLMFVFENRAFFCDRPYIGDIFFKAPNMLELFHNAGSGEAFKRELAEMEITHILYNERFHKSYPPPNKKDRVRQEALLELFREFLDRHCAPLFADGGATIYAISY